jgi:hypothetical protein
MTLKYNFSFAPSDENLTGFASNVTGAAFTITTTSVPDGLAHQVSIRNDTGNSHVGKTITLVGTDADGAAQTEVVTGPGGGATVESTKYFKTLTSATPSASIGADTFDIGWVDEIASRTIMLDSASDAPGALVQVDIGGTINFSLQVTAAARDLYTGQESWPWIATTTTGLFGATADKMGNLVEVGSNAMRFITASYSSGATAAIYVSEPATGS